MKQFFVVMTLVFVIGPAAAEQEININEDRQARDDARRLEQLFRKIGNTKFAAGIIGKNHGEVKAAFRDSVKLAKRSTVIVRVNGRNKALGTVVDADGFVITKASELSDGNLTCRLAGREVEPATLVGVDNTHDIAMLKIRRSDLIPIEWNKLSLPSIGSWLATCSPTPDPLAVGVVSVGARRIRREHGVLGIEMEKDNSQPLVTTVMDGSGAAEAGVKPDDLVLSVDGRRVATQIALITEIRKFRPGDTVRIEVERDEEQLEISATLGRVADFDPNVIEFQGFIGGKLSMRRSGFPSVIQHDTVLLPNQCGGPVVDLDGRFVGINIARADRTASYIIPAVSIRPLLDDLKAGGDSRKTRLTSRE